VVGVLVVQVVNNAVLHEQLSMRKM
jgi:hypothetical protein